MSKKKSSVAHRWVTDANVMNKMQLTIKLWIVRIEMNITKYKTKHLAFRTYQILVLILLVTLEVRLNEIYRANSFPGRC